MQEIIYTFLITSAVYSTVLYFGYRKLKNNGLGLLMKMMSETSKDLSKDNFKIEIREKVLMIRYTKDNINYTIPIPYDKSKRVKHANRVVKVFYNDGTKEHLNLPPGVELHATSHEMGGYGLDITY